MQQNPGVFQHPHYGLTACSKIREFSNIPIILLTAKADDMDKLMGFDHGADDYLTKPFNILELKARIRALLRRAGPEKQAPSKADDMDKLMGFDHGADDYLTKPFNILELKARIRALLRRAGPEKQAPSNTLTIGTISLDLDARNAYRSGVLVDFDRQGI